MRLKNDIITYAENHNPAPSTLGDFHTNSFQILVLLIFNTSKTAEGVETTAISKWCVLMHENVISLIEKKYTT